MGDISAGLVFLGLAALLLWFCLAYYVLTWAVGPAIRLAGRRLAEGYFKALDARGQGFERGPWRPPAEESDPRLPTAPGRDIGDTPLTQHRPAVYTYEAPGMPLCPQCNRRPAILHCLCHKLSLCLQCVGAHDRPQECSYVPNWRVVNLEAAQEQTPGSAGRAQKRKTGDVFGIS